ncbi:HU family DNA-binding protein [Streptomyces sp. NPDC014802]|uniref:HU family DNA-binding protein n=1 Tax=Streptomyces sp. NPDC014802 TaxID=3364917 RepID=UPI0036F5E947
MKKPARITSDLNTTSLIEVVAADTDIPVAQAREIVMATFDAITRAAAGGYNVSITNFVSFLPYRTKQRKARNPQNGEVITVPAHQVVRVRQSAKFVEMIRRRDRKATIRKAAKGSLSAAE